MSAKKESRKKWPVLIWAILATLISCEVLTRLAISSPSRHEFDPLLGFKYTPDSWYMNAKEGWAYHKINSIGLMDDELPKTGVSTNIVFLGDSVVESIQLPQHKNFTSLLESEYENLNVINGGQGGFNPSHYPFILDRIKSHTNVDFVFLLLHPSEINGLVKKSSVDYVKDDAGNVIDILPKPRANDVIKGKIEPIIMNSALATHALRQIKPLFNDAKKGLSELKNLVKAKKTSTTNIPTPRPPNIKNLVTEHGADRLKLILEKLQLRSNNQLAIVYYELIEYTQGPSTNIVNHFNEQQAYHQAANSLGIPIFNLSSHFEKHYKSTYQPPIGFSNLNPRTGHLNESGHKLVALAIKEIINKNELIKGIIAQ